MGSSTHPRPGCVAIGLVPGSVRRYVRRGVPMSRQNLGRLIFVAALAAILIAVFALGWANDNAKPCSQGRAQVRCPATETSR